MKGSRIRRTFHLILASATVLLLVLSTSCSPSQKTDDWRNPGSTSTPTVTTPTTPTAPMPSPAQSMPPMQESRPQPVTPSVPKATMPPQQSPVSPTAPWSPPQYSSGGNIGLAVGGAKDIDNFRENIKKGFLPLPTDVTYEGLFYDYYFETGQPEETNKLFSPSYSYAVSADPFSGQTDYYLSVGLNSGMKENDFRRKKLNLVVVLDISGSMDSPFNQYYYDPSGKQITLEPEEIGKSKVRVATETVVTLLNHLNADDRFGMVVFNDDAQVTKPLALLRNTDVGALKSHILALDAYGSTNLDSGIQKGTGLFDELTGVDPSRYENRIIFLTDAMPNTGDTSQYGLMRMAERNAVNRIFTTFIGIGVDFNSGLVESITKMKGANYYSVHSTREFRQRLDEEFDYMVTPLVFDLTLSLKAVGWEIAKVYGSPEAGHATGELMRVSTLFPSKKVGGETKGGLILLKLRKTGPNGSLLLSVNYEDRNGRPDFSEAVIRLDGRYPEYYQNDGIRKGVLLARYADLLKNWMIDERQHVRISTPWMPMIDDHRGIIVPPMLSQWERQSMPLVVSGQYPRLFGQFLSHFNGEMRTLNDKTLQQEADILRELSRNSQIGRDYPVR